MKDTEREKLVEATYKASDEAYQAEAVAEAFDEAYKTCVSAHNALRDYDEKKAAKHREDEVNK